MADEFKSVVEQATGRVVKAFLSDTNLAADVSVEFFLLGPQRTDMRVRARARAVDHRPLPTSRKNG
jgi:hypothetical protein